MAVNGPELVHCDSIVREAMGSYWGGKMHFVRRKSNPSVKTYSHSEAIDTMVKKPPKFPFML